MPVGHGTIRERTGDQPQRPLVGHGFGSQTSCQDHRRWRKAFDIRFVLTSDPGEEFCTQVRASRLEKLNGSTFDLF